MWYMDIPYLRTHPYPILVGKFLPKTGGDLVERKDQLIERLSAAMDLVVYLGP